MSATVRISLLTIFIFGTLTSVIAASKHTTHKQPKPNPIVYTEAALADQITNLPGLPTQPAFNQFAGYLAIDLATNKSIFYWYTESQNEPATDPLIWWSNGGPGCSGLVGFLTEHGPFRPSEAGDGGLEYFPYAWNRLANTLYVEAPIGVGFSFSNNASDYHANDNSTASDNFAAIQAFFIKFPHLVYNDFYISSESYGGHYVPELAVVMINEGGMEPNFKGFLLGNPLATMTEMFNGEAATMCGHALASYPTCIAFQQACYVAEPGDNCTNAQNNVMNEAGKIDQYGVDYPTCPTSSKELVKRHELRHLYHHRMQHKSFPQRLKFQLSAVPEPYDPCKMTEEAVYLNRPDVQAAIHANTINGPWMACGGKVQYDYNDQNIEMQGYYTYLLENAPQLRMLIYSGDDDGSGPTLGTMSWMFPLFGSNITTPWHQWTYTSEEYGQQIGGSLIKFDGISFATVHGAGHMVSGYQPEKGFVLFENFLSGKFN